MATHRFKQAGRGKRKRQRNASGMASGESVVAGSAGTAVNRRRVGAAQLQRTRTRMVATCTRGNLDCEFATRSAASHAVTEAPVSRHW